MKKKILLATGPAATGKTALMHFIEGMFDPRQVHWYEWNVIDQLKGIPSTTKLVVMEETNDVERLCKELSFLVQNRLLTVEPVGEIAQEIDMPHFLVTSQKHILLDDIFLRAISRIYLAMPPIRHGLGNQPQAIRDYLVLAFTQLPELSEITMTMQDIRTMFFTDRKPSVWEVNQLLKDLGVDYLRDASGRARMRRGRFPIIQNGEISWKEYRGNPLVFTRDVVGM